MNITNWAIKNKTITTVAIVIVILAGIDSYRKIPQYEVPQITIKTAMVMTFFPGASPERVEQLVTDKLEKVFQEIPEVDNIKSDTKMGVSSIYVTVKDQYKNMRPIWDKLRRKVDSVKTSLPPGIYGPYVNDEFGDETGTLITITGKDFSYKELKDIADGVKDELLYIDEVAKVDIIGAQEERIFIEYDNTKLSKLGIPPFYIKHLLDTQNIIIPGGSINVAGKERIVLEPSGNLESIKNIENIIIRLPENKKVYYLKDLANVRRGYIDPPKKLFRYNGKDSLLLAITMRKGGNIVVLGKKIKEKIDQLQQKYPYGIDFNFLYLQSNVVEESVSDFMSNLGQSIIIVILVMLISLGLKTGILVASLIPITIILTFLMMYTFNISIDKVSLGALLIALGMLVDNAIVVSESIMVKVKEGIMPVDAAISSAKELYKPLLISSLTTSSAFLPIYLAESAMGEYVGPLFKVVAISLLSSWILALTMVPLLNVKFLKPPKKDENGDLNSKKDLYDSFLYRIYRFLLQLVLKNRFISVIIVISSFSAAMYGFKFVPKNFFPPSDRNMLTIDFKLPPSTPIERTKEVITKVEKYLEKEFKGKEVKKWGTFIGETAPRYVLVHSPIPPTEEIGFILMETESVEILEELQLKIGRYCDENFPEVIANIKPIPNGMPLAYPVAIRVSGKDTKKIFKMVNKIKEKLSTIDKINFITDDWGLRSKKLKIEVDQIKAYHSNLTSQDVALSLMTSLSGMEVGKYRENDQIIPIILRGSQKDRDSVDNLDLMGIYSVQGRGSTPLKEIGNINLVLEPSKIARRDRYRAVTVQAGLKPGILASEIDNVMEPWLKENKIEGIKATLAGEKYESDKSNKSIGDKLPIAGLIIIMLLVIQFNSVKKPIILLLTIPLGMIGIVIGLLATSSIFGFMTLLAVVSLSGIVINNANVLMDRIRIENEELNLEPTDAIIVAAQKRLRPILLTTLTTVGGLIPLWISGGSLWTSMAIAMIFGLLFATLLTTLVIPLLYSIFHRVSFKNYNYKR